MAENPVKYSDLLQPDDSITKAIAQLEELKKTYTDMLKKISEDAKALETNLKKVSGATEEGQQKTKAAASEADKLRQQQDKLKQSQSNVGIEMAKLKQIQQEQNNITKLEIKLNKSKEGSYNKLSAQYSLNKIRLNKMSAEERKSTKAGQELEKSTKAIYEEMKRLQEATGKHQLNVGNYADALGSVPGPAGQVVQATKGVTKQLSLLAANPVIAVIVGIVAIMTALIAAMKRSEEGQDRLNKVMTIASSIFDNIMDVLTNMGIILFDTLPAIFKRFGTVFSKTFNELKLGILTVQKLWNEWTGDAAKAEEIAKQIDVVKANIEDLTKKQKEYEAVVSEGWKKSVQAWSGIGAEIKKDIDLAKQLADSQAKYNKDERKFTVENAKLRGEAAKAEADAEKLKRIDAEESIRLLNESFDINEKTLANELDLAKQRASILKQKSALAVDDIEAKKEIADAEAEVFNLETRFDELRRQRLRRLNMLRMEAYKQERERATARVELTKLSEAETIRANQAIIKSDTATAEEKQKALLENAKMEADLLRRETQINVEELDKRKELELISEEDYALQRKVLEEKLRDDILQISEGLAEDQAKVNTDKLEADKKAAEDAKKAAKERYDISLAAIEQETDLRYSEIDIMKATEAEKTRLRLQAEKDRLKAILELNKAGTKQLSDQEIETIKNTIAKIDQEMQSSKNTDFDLYALAGIKMDDDQKEAINTSTQFAIGQVQAFLQAKIEAAQAAVDAANTEKYAAQSKLDAEIEARNNGYASNVSMAQKELALAKKNQEKALKDQEKAQKAQAAIETLQQVGSLVTASAKIWAQLGFPWAIPAIALMFGSFAAAKLKAAQVSKSKTESYGEGTVELLEGGSHQSGNDIEFGTKKDGTKRRAEGGEFFAVLNKRSSRKYRRLFPDIVKSLNKGVFEKKYWGAFDMGGMSINMAGGNDLRSLESDVNAIRKQGEKQIIPDGKGGYIIKYKNLTTYVN
jgi:hypothetical protein